MSAKQSVHIWMPDGRSLCDKQALVRPLGYTFGEYPTCQECALALDHLINTFNTIVVENGNPKFSPMAAKRNLLKTRWADFGEYLGYTAEFTKKRGTYQLHLADDSSDSPSPSDTTGAPEGKPE